MIFCQLRPQVGIRLAVTLHPFLDSCGMRDNLLFSHFENVDTALGTNYGLTFPTESDTMIGIYKNADQGSRLFCRARSTSLWVDSEQRN